MNLHESSPHIQRVGVSYLEDIFGLDVRWRRHGGQPLRLRTAVQWERCTALTRAVDDLDSTRARFSMTGEQQGVDGGELYDAATRGPVMDLCGIWRSGLTGVCVVVRESNRGRKT